MDQSKSASPGDTAGINSAVAKKSISDTAMAVENFTAFTACLRAAGLTDALAARGPFTAFVPTDAAFKKIPSEAYEALLRDPARLRAVLNYHIIPGYFMMRDMKSGEIKTLQGSTLKALVSSTELRVNDVPVVQADIVATNGVVHGIDAIILPKNWRLLAAAA